MRGFLNVVVLIVMGVMLADLVAHKDGTAAVFSGVGSLWKTSINGLLGQPTTPQAGGN